MSLAMVMITGVDSKSTSAPSRVSQPLRTSRAGGYPVAPSALPSTSVQEVFGGGSGPVGDLDQVAMRGGADRLLDITNLDLRTEVHLGIRRQVEHPQDLRLWRRQGAHFVHVPHGRLGDAGNLLGVPLLRQATWSILLLGPSGGSLLDALVASCGRLHLWLQARFGGGEVAGQSSQLRRQRRHLAVLRGGSLLSGLRGPLVHADHGIAGARRDLGALLCCRDDRF
jgi:hypothetical protein